MVYGLSGQEAGASAQMCSQAGAWEQEEEEFLAKREHFFRPKNTIQLGFGLITIHYRDYKEPVLHGHLFQTP
jgi:hypothetical protein